jgi:hypothetical protein
VNTRSSTAKGSVDINATIISPSVNIEAKIRRQAMSNAQLQQQAKEEAAGALCFIASDMPSFIAWHKQTFANCNSLI